MNVCVQGLWHLGTVTAACLASLGNKVIGLDFDTGTVRKLQQGIPPLFEAGLEELVKEGIASRRLEFSSQPREAVAGCEVLWITYDTPVDDDDNADVDFVVSQIEQTLPHLQAGTTVLVSSQMPVGSVTRLEAIARNRFPKKEISFACTPENLRLGRSIEVFLNPDRIVVGVRSAGDRRKLDRLLRPISNRIEWMSVESAEMTKHAINAFLATSVAFANEIAAICELVGADAKEVERGLKTESRIGPGAYLSPGAAFAGGTLARDIAFLNKIGAGKHLSTPLLAAVRPSNDVHKQWPMRKLQALFPDLSRVRIAVWGLTYKPGTDTLRRSMAVDLCNWLADRGALVCVHDPAITALPEELAIKLTRADNPLAALNGAQALVVSTPWPDYRSIAADAIVNAAPGIAVLDAGRLLASLATESRLRYIAVGIP
jgi:UDPglucose 6-dehydrogenase